MQSKRTVGVYRIANIVTGKCYIGSSNNIARRWQQHRNSLDLQTHHNGYLQRSWIKYGADAFVFSIIEECSLDCLIATEQHYLDTEQPEYNINPLSAVAPMLGRKHGESTLEKLRAVVFGDERRAKMRAAHEQRWTPEARERQRLSHLGQIPSPESIEKRRLASIGHVVSEETRKKISAANSGRPSTRKGQPRSAETKEKIGLAHRGRVHGPDVRQRMSEAQRARGPRRPHSEETRRKIGDAHRGKSLSAEQRARISQVQTGRKQTPETREKIRLGNLGRTHTAAARAAISAAMSARVVSPETRQKMREIALRQWERKRQDQ